MTSADVNRLYVQAEETGPAEYKVEIRGNDPLAAEAIIAELRRRVLSDRTPIAADLPEGLAEDMACLRKRTGEMAHDLMVISDVLAEEGRVPTAADRGEGEAADNQNYVVEKLMEALTEAADRGQFTKALEAAVEAVGCIYEDLRTPPTSEGGEEEPDMPHGVYAWLDEVRWALNRGESLSKADQKVLYRLVARFHGPTSEGGEERDLRCRCQSLPGGKQHPDCPMDGHGLPDSRPLDAGARRRELADELDALRSSEAVERIERRIKEMIPSPEGSGGEDDAYARRLARRIVQALSDSPPSDTAMVGQEALEGTEAEGCFVLKGEELERAIFTGISNAFFDGEIRRTPAPSEGEDFWRDVHTLAGFILGWWPGLEDAFNWPQPEKSGHGQRVYEAAKRLREQVSRHSTPGEGHRMEGEAMATGLDGREWIFTTDPEEMGTAAHSPATLIVRRDEEGADG